MFKKLLFNIYTNDPTIKRSILYINKQELTFNNDGIIQVFLRPKNYEFSICNQTFTFPFINPYKKIILYREDNDCHFNIIGKEEE